MLTCLPKKISDTISVSIKAVKREKVINNSLKGYRHVFIRVSDVIHSHLRNIPVMNMEVCL